jgi:pimeloyl-ACP methyl ester carboxylesterase
VTGDDPRSPHLPTRRGVLVGGGAGLFLAGAAAAIWATPPGWRAMIGHTDAYIPTAAEGTVRLDSVASAAMGRNLDLFTAVPAGYGDGAGLPVVVVLHGASASVGDFREFGFGHFVTAAVQAGAPPFVLAGTDDGPAGWLSDGGVDPPTMLRDELPGWLADRGLDADRRVVWGWSRGGYGALRFALETPDYARAWALFSPAVSSDDPALDDLSALDGVPLAFWCGTDDGHYDDLRAVIDRLPSAPEVTDYAEGGHTRMFWNDHTLDAFRWLAERLTADR